MLAIRHQYERNANPACQSRLSGYLLRLRAEDQSRGSEKLPNLVRPLQLNADLQISQDRGLGGIEDA